MAHKETPLFIMFQAIVTSVAYTETALFIMFQAIVTSVAYKETPLFIMWRSPRIPPPPSPLPAECCTAPVSGSPHPPPPTHTHLCQGSAVLLLCQEVHIPLRHQPHQLLSHVPALRDGDSRKPKPFLGLHHIGHAMLRRHHHWVQDEALLIFLSHTQNSIETADRHLLRKKSQNSNETNDWHLLRKKSQNSNETTDWHLLRKKSKNSNETNDWHLLRKKSQTAMKQLTGIC